MVACILELPKDVMELVLTLFDDDKPTLCKLALTCKPLLTQCRMHLVRYVDVARRQWRSNTVGFAALLEKHPVLRQSVRTLSVWSLDIAMGDGAELMKAILGGLTGLQSLRIEREWACTRPGGQKYESSYCQCVPSHDYNRAPHDEVTLNFMDHDRPFRTRSLEVVGNFTLTELHHLMELDGLESFSATEIRNLEVSSEYSFAKAGPLPIKIFSLIGSSDNNVTAEVLTTCLNETSGLQELRARLPGAVHIPQRQGIVLRTPHRPKYVRMLDRFSPTCMRSVLEPVAHSLATLDLLTGHTIGLGPLVRWPGRHPGTLDLSGCERLRVAKLPSICFFASDVPHDQRVAASCRLPQSLETLIIGFDTDTGIFYTETEYKLHAKPPPEHTGVRQQGAAYTYKRVPEPEPGRVAWLVRLIRALAVDAPSMRCVEMNEGIAHPLAPTTSTLAYRARFWLHSDAMAHALTQTPIQRLVIKLRYPIDYEDRIMATTPQS